MQQKGWLSDVLQRIGYKGAASPEAEAVLGSSECASLRAAISQLGCADVYTQEELACYRRLEAEGTALSGPELWSAVQEAGLDADPRLQMDRLSAGTAQQRQTLDRLQRRCETLTRQSAQFAALAAAATEEAAASQRLADEREQALTRQYNAAVSALNAAELECVTAANALGGGGGGGGVLSQPHLLFSFCDDGVRELEGRLRDLAGRVRPASEELLTQLSDGRWAGAAAEVRRLADAHAVSRFGLLCGEGERAGAATELEFLTGVASGGNPDVDVPADELRARIEGEQRRVEGLRAAVKQKAKELFAAVTAESVGSRAAATLPCNKAGGSGDGEDFAATATQFQKARLRDEIDSLDDLLHYLRQHYAVSALARAWLHREGVAAASLKDAIGTAHAHLQQHVDLSTMLGAGPAGAAAAAGGDDQRPSKEKLLRLAAPTEAADPSQPPPASVSDAAAAVQNDVASLEAACARYHAEDHATTTSLMEGYRQLLTCLESQREPAPSSRSLVAEPQTYFEADLRALKAQADKASKRMLTTMGHVDSAKQAAFDDWAFDVHDPNAVADAGASGVRGAAAGGADAAIDTSVHSVTHLAGILSGMSTPGGGDGRAASPPPPPSTDRRGVRHAARSPPSRASTPRKTQQQPQPQPQRERRHEAAAAAASPSTPRRQKQHPASPVDPLVTPLTRDTAASSLSALYYDDAAATPQAEPAAGGGGGGSRVDASSSLLHEAATPPARRGRGAGGRHAASPAFAHDSTMNTSVQSSASSVHRLMSAMGTPQKAQRGGGAGGGGGGGGGSSSTAHNRTRTRSPASTARKPSPGRPAKRVASPAARKPPAAAAAPAPAPVAPVPIAASQPRVPSFLLRADGTKMTPEEYRMRNEKLLANLRR